MGPSRESRSNPIASSRANQQQYLTFRLDSEVYAFDVASAREILDFTPITPIPSTPHWVRGVINLRGNVVPVLDLKLKMGLAKTERTRDTCIIIIEADFGDEEFTAGVLADSVQEVFEMSDDDINVAPKLGDDGRTDYIRGMGRRNETFFVILDVKKVFTAREIALIGARTNVA